MNAACYAPSTIQALAKGMDKVIAHALRKLEAATGGATIDLSHLIRLYAQETAGKIGVSRL